MLPRSLLTLKNQLRESRGKLYFQKPAKKSRCNRKVIDRVCEVSTTWSSSNLACQRYPGIQQQIINNILEYNRSTDHQRYHGIQQQITIDILEYKKRSTESISSILHRECVSIQMSGQPYRAVPHSVLFCLRPHLLCLILPNVFAIAPPTCLCLCICIWIYIWCVAFCQMSMQKPVSLCLYLYLLCLIQPNVLAIAPPVCLCLCIFI